MIHIYTGNGKGKTTSVFGMAMRASGQGLKVIIYQFLKPKTLLCGEHVVAKKIKGIKLVRFNQTHPMFNKNVAAVSNDAKSIEKDFNKAKKAILSKKYDMVILDEVINALDQNFIDQETFLKLLKTVPQKVELVLTGRGDISSIEQFADYITVMIDKKHPLRKSIGARKGIEY
ncbi:MAG: cob(I)yrinic acid a,c-diamide adenosyltransferase [Candidatus Omnitrophica bacterium]|nr:cob(I)yrinic acid a,c-diamide adenosyltransferase [Candidatus Omnitrophota bacterium]